MAGENPISFAGLDRQHAAIEEELRRALDRVIGSSAFILGEEVAAFESGVRRIRRRSPLHRGLLGHGRPDDRASRRRHWPRR